MDERYKDGTHLVAENHWSLVFDENARPKAIFCIKTDVTRRIVAERKIHHLAFYDQLTVLPNRALLTDRLQQALAETTRSLHQGSLLFIDLDNFKAINDTLGHDKGDLLLQVALRLAGGMRDSDTVARFAGDEFAVMLKDLSQNKLEAVAQAREVGEKILTSCEKRHFQRGTSVWKSRGDSLD